jgi:sugar fermentation stimulation protein A
MKFKERLLQGSLEKRYKRFFLDIKYKNKIITSHCPNTGSMMGLLKKNNKVWFSKSTNPNRKLKYTTEIIEVNGFKVGINTLLTNKIVFEALNNKKIKELNKYNNIKPEFKFSNGTRFDFLLSNNKEKCLLEVKNVTLNRKNNIAEFPDAITTRGTKHLNELCNGKKNNFKSYILYLIQIESCDSFKIASDIDKEYKAAFDKALNCGVKILCYNCKLTNEEIKLNNKINYDKRL